MPSVSSYDALGALFTTWRDLCANGAEPVDALRTVLAQGGTRLSAREIRFAFIDAGPLDDITEARFADGMIPILAERDLRLTHAFRYFGEVDAVPMGRVQAVMGHFAADSDQLAAMLQEMDANGDEHITLVDFRRFYPDDETVEPTYSAAHVHPDRIGTSAVMTETAATPDPERSDGAASEAYTSTSPLQMQIGFFRLLQGAAYRSFRESYSANAETHLRARDLPYTITDFDEFVSAAVDFYLSLGIVHDAEAAQEFDRLAQMVSNEVDALETRIEAWGQIEKSDQMLQAEARLDEELSSERSHRALFADTVEILLALRLHGVPENAVGPDSLNQFELNRLSHLELQSEHHDAGSGASDDAHTYLDAWNPVNMAGGARVEGAIMPARFWYEQFMPQLLRCASIMSAADLAAETGVDEATLDAWHAEQVKDGSFEPFATDVRDGYGACSPEIKLALKQAWRLTEHYLNGLEKRREREEFGRGSGYLSQYVAFIDVWLGRSDVAQSEMRVSFPYYIGPAVWCLLHSSAELVEALDETRRADAIAKFKRFITAFATMYPCPYCRHHFNRYVAINQELDRYPVEFLFLGQQVDKAPLDISLADRLSEISADKPGSFRRFIWKLHNAVSSSIARTEDWYHEENKPIYTTRYWPGLEAEIGRARALGLDAVPVDKLSAILEILKPATRLATLRDELQIALRAGDSDTVAKIAEAAQGEIDMLDDAVEDSSMLQRTYTYDPTKTEEAPHFSPQEEAFARSGRFIER